MAWAVRLDSQTFQQELVYLTSQEIIGFAIDAYDMNAKISRLLIIMILISNLPCLAKIPPGPCFIFESKVTSGDEDEGNPLNFCCHGFGFKDIGMYTTKTILFMRIWMRIKS